MDSNHGTVTTSILHSKLKIDSATYLHSHGLQAETILLEQLDLAFCGGREGSRLLFELVNETVHIPTVDVGKI
jgi:hypothetical protein